MTKYSVRRPYTVLVGVILIIVLGVVSILNETTDMLPEISLPYIVVATVDPGASPEMVEADVTKVLEDQLATVTNVKNVSSRSNENFSMIMLEFAQGTNMDSAMVKVSAAVNQAASQLPETAGTPTLLEINPNMIATQYVAIDYAGMDLEELSSYVSGHVIPYYERIDGVASVSASGLVEKEVHITVSQRKIDDLNDRLLSLVNEQLDEAKKQLDAAGEALDAAKEQIDEGREQLEAGQQALQAQQEEISQQMRRAIDGANSRIASLENSLNSVKEQADSAQSQLDAMVGNLEQIVSALPNPNGITDSYQLLLSYLEAFDADYDAETMPSGWEDALSSADKLAALEASVSRASTSRVTELTASREAAAAQVESITGEVTDLQQQETVLQLEILQIQAQLAAMQAEDAASEESAAAESSAAESSNAESSATESSNAEPAAASETSTVTETSTAESSAASESSTPADSSAPTESSAPAESDVESDADREAERKALEEELAQKQEELAALQANREAKQEELNQATSDLAAIQAELSTLDSIGNLSADQITQTMNTFSSLDARLQDAITIYDRLQELDDRAADISLSLSDARTMLGNLTGLLAQYQANPLDSSLGDEAAQLILSGMNAQLTLGSMTLAEGEQKYEEGKAQYEAALEEYNKAREEALANAKADSLLDITTISQLIYAQNFSMPAGYIEGGKDDDNSYVIKIGNEIASADELENLILVTVDGIGNVRIKDVADVEITDNSEDSYARVNREQAVLLSIYKSSTASTSEVADACNDLGKELEKSDPNLHVTVIMDQGEYIHMILRSVLTNLIEGAILAMIVLAFFLKDWKPTVVVALSMPLSVLFALVLMYFSHISLNMVSLSGLALGIGMLVDNSIVVIENIYRLRSRGVAAPTAAVQGASQVRSSIVSSTLTTICVFLPMFFTQGLIRQLMMDMALTITFSLLASLFVALTFVPTAGSTVLQKQTEKKHPFMDRVMKVYKKSLRWCLKRKWVPLAIAIILLVVSASSLIGYGMQILPSFSSNQISATLILPQDTPKEKAFEYADRTMDALMDVKGIDRVGVMNSASAGSAVSGIAGFGSSNGLSNSYTYYMVLDQDGGRHQKRVVDDINKISENMDVTLAVSTTNSMDISLLTGSGIEIDIRGQSMDKLREISYDIMDRMKEIDGIENISNGESESDKEVHIVIDKDKVRENNLTVAQIYQTLAVALTKSTTAVRLTFDGIEYKVIVEDETRVPNLDNILNYEFTAQTFDLTGATGQEKHILSEFATVEMEPAFKAVNRENGSRIVTISSSTAEGYSTNLLAGKVQKILDEVEIPDGYTAEIAGENSSLNDMVSSMAQMILLALIMIYLIMVAQFQSLKSPFIVLFTIPLAFTGGMFALIIAGEKLSMMSLMGFLILMGVVVNNGIVFVDYTNQLRLGGVSKREALVASGETRMRPILMTTLTTVLAMITMLLSKDVGSELGRGLALVIIGGLIYATLMTLYIIPVMYDIFSKKELKEINIDETGMDEMPDDAEEYLQRLAEEEKADQAEPADRKDSDV
ncbi:MAG: efflux RND transporter permease subunit [Firmicutes bacterium]|nr:efflux RND transporter permease subunit [Bacillota bacterium]